MKSKPQSRIGDIFEVKGNGLYRYFQFAALDITQLNSDVVAVYKGVFSEPQKVEDIAILPVDFFSHTTVRVGLPKYWQKIGKGPIVNTSLAIFKDVDDLDEEDAAASAKGSSDQWCIWHIGEDFTKVGEYKNVPEHAELGLVFNAESLVMRILEGRYDFVYGYYGVDR